VGRDTGRITIDTDASTTPLVVEVSVDVTASVRAEKPVGQAAGKSE